MSARRHSPLGLAIVALGAIGLWWFFPREDADKDVWRFSPDVSLLGGNSRARSVVLSPNGRTLAVSTLVFPSTYPRSVHAPGSRQRRCEVQLWDVLSHQRQNTVIISNADVPRGASEPEMAFSRDGQQLRFWGIGTTTWDVITGTRLSAQPDGQPAMNEDEFGLPRAPWRNDRKLVSDYRGAAVSNDGLWFAGQFLNSSRQFSGEFVRVWRRVAVRKNWQLVGTIPATVFNNQIIYDLALNRNGKLLAVALDSDGPLQLFETKNLRFWKNLPSSNRITQVVFSPDGHDLLGCGGSNMRVSFGRRRGVLNFWNLGTGNLERTINTPKILHNPVFSPDGRWVGATEGEATVFVCQSPLYKQTNSAKP